MNETHKIWLIDLYENEIIEKERAIRNEKIWRDAITDKDAIKIMRENIKVIKEYIEIIKEKINELKGED